MAALSLPAPAPMMDPAALYRPAAPGRPAPSGPAANAADPAAVKAAREFEAVFIGQMTEAMFAGLETPEPFGGGHAETLWRSMLAQEMGASIARAGGIGVADAVLREMIALQENAQP